MSLILKEKNSIKSNSWHLCNVFGNDDSNISSTNSCVRISGYLRSVVTAGDNVYLAEKPVCGMIDGNGFLVRLYTSIPFREPNRNV